MSERVEGTSKRGKVGQKPAAAPPAPAPEPKLPDLATDGADVRHRPSSPEELLARMVRRAKEAEEAAEQIAQGAVAGVAETAGKIAGNPAVKDAVGSAKEAAEAAAGAVKGAVPGAKEALDEAGQVDPPAPALGPGAPREIELPAPQKVESEQAVQRAKKVPAPAQIASEPTSQPAAKGFWGGLWDKVKSTAGTAWTWTKGAAAKIWGSIKAFSDKIGLTKGLQWLLPKIGDGLKWLQQKLQWAVYGVSFAEFKTRKVYDDPGDVNSPDFAEVQKAKKEIPERAAAEKAALEKLPEADRKKYEKLADLTKGRPLSRWALQNMLLDGRLPGGKALVGEANLLDNLSKMASQDLASGIKREDLVSDVVAEIENPVRINQQGKGTCVATTAQILLARRNPAEYARVIADLAAPAGKARTAGGGTLEREADWAHDSDYGRSTSTRLISPALMEMGMPLLDYDNTKDKHKAWVVPVAGGLMGFGSAKINEQLLGVDYTSLGFWHWNRDSQWNKVRKALEEGKGPLPVGVTWEDLGGHQLQIDKIENGKVYYTNPWGQRESMDEAEFKSHVTNVEVPTGRKVS